MANTQAILDWTGSPIVHSAGPVVSRSLENPAMSIEQALSEWNEMSGGPTWTGRPLNAERCLFYGPWWRGVNMISGDIARVGLFIMRRVGRGKERDLEHPAYKLLWIKPNQYMSAFVFKRQLVFKSLDEGNSYARIVRDGDGNPVELLLLRSSLTWPVLEAGVLYYKTIVNDTEVSLPASDVIHVRGLSEDGIKGFSVWKYARQTIAEALAAQEYGARFFSNNARADIAIEHPALMGEEAYKRLKKSWEEKHQGLSNAHKTAILEEGAKLHEFTKSAKDSQLVELRAHMIREASNWLGVPPHKLGDTSRQGYNSLEMENQDYLDQALDPRMVAIEQEFYDKLLSERQKDDMTHAVEFHRNQLIRANMSARGAFYTRATSSPWMTVNETRALESMNPIEDSWADEIQRPVNIFGAGDVVVSDGEDDGDDSGEEQPPDEDRTARRVLLHDVFCRSVKRLMTGARRAGEDKAKARKWLDGIRGGHEKTVCDMIRPVVAVCCGRSAADSELAAVAIVKYMFDAVGRGVGDLADIEKRADRIERELPIELAELALRGNGNGK